MSDPEIVTAPTGVEIRQASDPRFADQSGVTSSIQADIDKALSNLHPEEKGAVVVYADTNKDVKASVFGKVSDQWSYVLSAEHTPGDWAQGWDGSAMVRFSWR